MQEIKEYECPYCHTHLFMKRGGFSNHMRFCEKNPQSHLHKQKLSEKRYAYLESNKLPINKYIFKCKECGNDYTIELTDKQYKEHKYSNYCSKHCARKHASKCVSSNTKKVKCIDCGKYIYIKQRASQKTCRCDECKYI